MAPCLDSPEAHSNQVVHADILCHISFTASHAVADSCSGYRLPVATTSGKARPITALKPRSSVERLSAWRWHHVRRRVAMPLSRQGPTRSCTKLHAFPHLCLGDSFERQIRNIKLYKITVSVPCGPKGGGAPCGLAATSPKQDDPQIRHWRPLEL